MLSVLFYFSLVLLLFCKWHTNLTTEEVSFQSKSMNESISAHNKCIIRLRSHFDVINVFIITNQWNITFNCLCVSKLLLWLIQYPFQGWSTKVTTLANQVISINSWTWHISSDSSNENKWCTLSSFGTQQKANIKLWFIFDENGGKCPQYSYCSNWRSI